MRRCKLNQGSFSSISVTLERELGLLGVPLSGQSQPCMLKIINASRPLPILLIAGRERIWCIWSIPQDPAHLLIVCSANCRVNFRENFQKLIHFWANKHVRAAISGPLNEMIHFYRYLLPTRVMSFGHEILPMILEYKNCQMPFTFLALISRNGHTKVFKFIKWFISWLLNCTKI